MTLIRNEKSGLVPCWLGGAGDVRICRRGAEDSGGYADVVAGSGAMQKAGFTPFHGRGISRRMLLAQ